MNAHMHANRSDASATNFMPGRSLLLQRQCACGSSAGASGECAACANKRRLQAKLSIGASNDPLEQEADRVADQVLAGPVHPAVNTAPNIQRYTGHASSVAGTAPASVDQVLASRGRSLESGLKQDMGQRLGYDFSRVRVHADAIAAQSARDVHAHAYTVGQNIVFAAGQFAPTTDQGRRLLAHELTHVVQQAGTTGMPVVQRQEAQTTTDPEQEQEESEHQLKLQLTEPDFLGLRKPFLIAMHISFGIRIRRWAYGGSMWISSKGSGLPKTGQEKQPI